MNGLKWAYARPLARNMTAPLLSLISQERTPKGGQAIEPGAGRVTDEMVDVVDELGLYVGLERINSVMDGGDVVGEDSVEEQPPAERTLDSECWKAAVA